MARPLRNAFPGAVYHVTRGDARVPRYAVKMNRTPITALLTQVVRRAQRRCQADCLTDDHYHRVLETPEGYYALGCASPVVAKALGAGLELSVARRAQTEIHGVKVLNYQSQGIEPAAHRPARYQVQHPSQPGDHPSTRHPGPDPLPPPAHVRPPAPGCERCPPAVAHKAGARVRPCAPPSAGPP